MEIQKQHTFQRIKWVASLIILLVALAQYINTIGHEYAWDDAIVITENQRVQEGLGGVADLFKSYRSDELSDQYGYRPLTLVSFAADVSIFGMNPHAAHGMNILFFALASLALFFTLTTLIPNSNHLFPLLITLLFICHPVHTEVVANIKSRDEILALLFSLLSLRSYIQFYRGRKWFSLGSSILLFGLAFISKENSFSILFLIPVALFMERTGTWKEKLIFASPTLVLIALALGGVALAGSSTLGSEVTEGTGSFVEPYVLGNPLAAPHFNSHRLATSILIVGKYLKLFLIPFPLIYFYGYNHVPITTWADPWVYISGVVQLGMIALAILRFRKNPALSLGILWYFISIFIYANALKILSDIMAERFLFMPSVGLCIALVAGLSWAVGIDWKKRPVARKKGKKVATGQFQQLLQYLLAPFENGKQKVFLGLMGVLLIAGFVRSFDRNKVWKDNLTLYSADMEKLDDCARAHFYYASELVRQLETQPNDPSIRQQIITHYNRSIEIHPKSFYSYIQLGKMYVAWQDFGNAIKVLSQVRDQFPQEALPRFELGQCYFFAGRLEEAKRELQVAVDLAPNLTEGHFFLALATFHGGRQQEGLQIIDETVNRFPEATYLYNAQSDFRIITGDTLGGINSLKTLIQYDPNHGPAYKKIVGRCQEAGLQNEANQYYNEALAKGVWQ